MRALKHFILMLGLLAPLAAAAEAGKAPAVAPAAALAGSGQAEAMAGRQAWGDKLPETLSISMWNSKDGEAKAGKLSTSREVFGASFEMGKEGKAGLKAAVAGRILPRGDGSYEVLLYVDLGGMDASKGGLSLKLQSSLILKKGVAAAVGGNQDGQLMVRLD